MDYPSENDEFRREVRRALAEHDRQFAEMYSKRSAIGAGTRIVKLARTIADPDQDPTYPLPGANVFPFAFLSGGFVDAQGAQTPSYSERWDQPQARCLAISGEYIPEGTEIFVWQDRGIDEAAPGEWWTPYSHETPVVYFQLYANKTLTTQPAVAEILRFNTGTLEWETTGVFFFLHDDYYNSPGFFTGKAGVDRGWARLLKRADPETEGDLDHYGLIWMSGPAHIVRFTLTADRTSGSDEAVAATINATYLYGHDQLAPTTVWFSGEEFRNAKSGAVGRAIYNDRERRYDVVLCDQLCLHATALLADELCGGDTVDVSDFTVETPFPWSQAPAENVDEEDEPLGTWTVTNARFHHRGRKGYPVSLKYSFSLGMYEIDDAPKYPIVVMTGWSIVDNSIVITGATIVSEFCSDSGVSTTIPGAECPS